MQPPASAEGRPALPSTAVPPAVRHAVAELAAAPAPVSAYVYDPAVAAMRARALRDALPHWVQVLFAAKANAFPPVLAALASAVDGFDVASVRELELAAAAARTAGRRLHVAATGPAKHPGLLAAFLDGDVDVVNVESPLELQHLSDLARQRGRTVPVALRVNPDAVPVTGALRLGGAPTAFGIAEADVGAALAMARVLPGIEVVGFHIHAVCQNLDAEAHAAYVDWCLTWAARTAEAHRVDLRVVDAGGGLGVAFEGEEPFDVAAFGDALDALRRPPGVTLVLEPGRWLAADCGVYAAEVVDLKRTHGTWFAVLRGGINHFLLPTSWAVRHPFAVVPVDGVDGPLPEVADAEVTVVGELCTSEDTLARDVRVERLRVGDVVVFPNAGAYGWEFAMHDFLGHPVADRVVACRPAGHAPELQAAGTTT